MANFTGPSHKLSASSKAMIRKILAFIRKHDNFLISGHVRSDGDALGSQLAFHHLLRKLKKKSHVVCDHGVLPDYRFLPGTRLRFAYQGSRFPDAPHLDGDLYAVQLQVWTR